MAKVKIGDLIDLSIERTKDVFFRPFQIKRFIKLIFIAWMAGALGGGGSSGFDIPTSWDTDYESFLRSGRAVVASIEDRSLAHAQSVDTSEDVDEIVEAFKAGQEQYYQDRTMPTMPSFGMSDGSWNALGITALVFFVIFLFLIIILFMWIGCRFKFIWFNAIVNKTDEIKAPWRHYKEQGNSLFGFYLIWLFLGLIMLAVLGLIFYFPGKAAGAFDPGFEWSVGAFFKLFGLQIFITFILIILLNIVYLWIEQFVVAIMGEKECSFKEAWNSFVDVYSEKAKKIWLYVLLAMAMGLIIGVITTILVIIGLIAVLIVAAIIFGGLYLVFGMLLNSQMLFTVFAIVLGIPFAVAVMLFLNGLIVPFVFFFRSFTLYYLSSLDVGYQPISLISQEPETL